MAGKPARMSGAYGYIMWAFTKAPQISSPSATTTRSSLYETQSLRHWTSHRSGSGPLSARPTRRFSTARSSCSSWSTDSLPLYGDSLFRELLYKRANISGVVANAAPFLGSPASRWQTRRVCFMLGCRPRWNSTHRDGMSPLQWHESLLSVLVASFLFREQPRPLRLPTFFLPGTCEEKAAGQRILAPVDKWAYVGCTPAYLTLSPQRAFTWSLHPLGPEEKGYDSLSPLDESVAAHLCPPTAIGWKAKATHPSKPWSRLSHEDYFSSRWTSLFIGWTSGLCASLHGGSASFPG